MANGTPPPNQADKQLGEIVNEVTTKASLLVKEEIELAKAEVAQKAKRLGIGAGLAAVAGAFLLFFLIFFLHFLARGTAKGFALRGGVCYGIVCILLLVFAGILGLVARRLFIKGSPPVPQ